MSDHDTSIQRILDEALALPTERRADFIADACGDDTHLLEQVRRRLLAVDGRPGEATAERSTVIETPVSDPQPLTESHPKRIASYTVRRIIGSGGMGTVYEATQDSPRRRVAIKVLKAGLTSRTALRRFQYESQVLGRLRHQGIAQIYEAGTWESERGDVPWFAMEYIPNAKYLTDYAREHKLTLFEKLTLFTEICQAVHHGHQKGIIHRDLKPGNILVDSSGQPKIIDFGVARSTDSDIAVTTLQTNVGQLIGTVQYMSPEQCDADPEDLDTRSDVYTLGVILYELLTGELPYNFSNKALHEAARAIKEDAPGNPSTINRQLRGDIETIVLTALEKDRDRRYQSAQALSEDIERFLRDDPISARPPSVLYQLKVLARKNRAAAVAAASIFITLIVAIVLVALFAVSQSNQKQLADEARLEADSRRDEAIRAQNELANQAEAARLAQNEATAQAAAASRARALADQRAREAETARDQAERASASLLEANQELERRTYVAALIRAQDAVRNQYPGEAARLLAEAPPAHRAWEWHMLKAQADQSLETVPLAFDPFAMSNDGRLLITGSTPDDEALDAAEVDVEAYSTTTRLAMHDRHDGTITMLPLPTDRHARSGDTFDVTFSPDDRYLVIWHIRRGMRDRRPESGCLLVWDLEPESPELLHRIDQIASGMVFTPDASAMIWIESPVPDKNDRIIDNIRIKNTINMLTLNDPDAEIVSIPGPEGQLNLVENQLAISPDGRRLACLSIYQGLIVTDLQTGEMRPYTHPDINNRLLYHYAFSSDGRSLLTCEPQSDVVHAIDLESGQPVDGWTLVPHNRIRELRGMPGQPLFVTADSTGAIRILKEETGELHGSFHGHLGTVRLLSVHGDGVLHSTADDDVLKRWSIEQQQQANPMRHLAIDNVDHIAIQDDGRLMITTSDEYLELWSLDLGRKLNMFPLPGEPRDLAVSPDGRYAAITLVTGIPIVILDLATGWPMELDIEAGTIFDNAAGRLGQPTCFSPDGRLVAFGLGSKIFLLDLRQRGRIVDSTEIDSPGVTAFERLSFTEDGERVLATATSGSLHEWAPGSKETRTLALHFGMGQTALSPDGTLLGTGSQSGRVVLHRIGDPEQLTTTLTDGYGLQVNDLSFSDDGTRLAVIWKDGTLNLFDVGSGTLILTLMNPTALQDEPGAGDDDVLDFNRRNKVVFGSDRSWLAMSHDRELYVWDSRPASQRAGRRREAQQRSTMARAIAEGLLADGDIETAIESVRSDDAIDDSLRHAALMEIMLQTSPWTLFEAGDYDAAKDRQMTLYRQLRAKHGLDNPRTQHVLEDLITIYEAMGNYKTARLLRTRLTNHSNQN